MGWIKSEVANWQPVARSHLPDVLVCSARFLIKKKNFFFLAIFAKGEIYNLEFRRSGKLRRQASVGPLSPSEAVEWILRSLFSGAPTLQFSSSPPGLFYSPVIPTRSWALRMPPLNWILPLVPSCSPRLRPKLGSVPTGR